MSVRGMRYCALIGLLVGLAGCSTTDFFNLNILQTTDKNGERILAGSLESVSQSAEGMLQGFGFSTVATRQESEIRIAATTPKGGRFFLVLTRTQVNGTEMTSARLEWENGKQDQVAIQVLAGLDALSRR